MGPVGANLVFALLSWPAKTRANTRFAPTEAGEHKVRPYVTAASGPERRKVGKGAGSSGIPYVKQA